MEREAYPSDVSDEEWALVAPYLTLMTEDAPQREHPLREVFNGLRYIVRTGGAWRLMPHDLPPWHTVYQQTQRWLAAGVFEDMVHDLRRPHFRRVLPIQFVHLDKGMIIKASLRFHAIDDSTMEGPHDPSADDPAIRQLPADLCW